MKNPVKRKSQQKLCKRPPPGGDDSQQPWEWLAGAGATETATN